MGASRIRLRTAPLAPAADEFSAGKLPAQVVDLKPGQDGRSHWRTRIDALAADRPAPSEPMGNRLLAVVRRRWGKVFRGA